MRFEELGLKSALLDALVKLGFEEATPIQEQAIPLLLSGDSDLVGLAQTGTGKTAAFGLPLLHLVREYDKEVQGLVVCPTRELCLQITKDLDNYSRFMPELKTLAVYGGTPIGNQIRAIKKGVQVIVATPGRLLDLINRGVADLQHTEYVVLDEADEMFNMGFKEDIEAILTHVPGHRKTWLFSATMAPPVADVAKRFMDHPAEVTIGNKNAAAQTVEHRYHLMHDRDRYLALKRVLDFYPDIYGIVFCQTRSHTREIADRLVRDGYSADALHGDLSQEQRDYVMKKYRSRSLQMLVATDVAARGIDVNDVTHVIHYSLPEDVENYNHRSGRTGRAGKNGMSIALVGRHEYHRLEEIQRIIGQKIRYHALPGGADICQRQLDYLMDQIKNETPDTDKLAPYIEQITRYFADESREAILAKVLSTRFMPFVRDYENARSIDLDPKTIRRSGSGGPGRRGGRTESGYQRIFINVGYDDGMDKGGILRLVCNKASIPGKSIGRIELKDRFSFVQVESHLADQIVAGMRGQQHEGRRLNAEFSKDRDSRGGYKKGGKPGYNRRGKRHH